jgi:drug/metabolite transporter (DMT)-like permease
MPPQPNPAPENDTLRPYLGVGFGVIVVSTAAILIRLAQAEIHSLTVAAWRLTLATLILTPIALFTIRAELRTLTGREWRNALLSGLLLAIHFGTWITSLALTSVAASVVLVWTNPIFVGLASHFLLGERMSRPMVIALAVAISGSVIIGLGDLGEGTHQLLGDLLAVMGAISGAGYFLIGRQLRARLSLLGYVYPVYGTAAVLLMVVLLVSGLPRVPQRSETWLWLALMALGPQILGHSSLNWALRYLSATYVTLATLGEPIGSALLAWWLLDEPPTPWTVVGGALILSGIVIASRARQAPADAAE